MWLFEDMMEEMEENEKYNNSRELGSSKNDFLRNAREAKTILQNENEENEKMKTMLPSLSSSASEFHIPVDSFLSNSSSSTSSHFLENPNYSTFSPLYSPSSPSSSLFLSPQSSFSSEAVSSTSSSSVFFSFSSSSNSSPPFSYDSSIPSSASVSVSEASSSSFSSSIFSSASVSVSEASSSSFSSSISSASVSVSEASSSSFSSSSASVSYFPQVYDEQSTVGLSSIEEDIFESLKTIKDPEFSSYTLGSLRVITPAGISVRCEDGYSTVCVTYTPTASHCSMATLIGLCIRCKLNNEFDFERLKIDIIVKEEAHDDAKAVTKQINDKERVAAALENPNLMEIVENSIKDYDD